MAYFNNQNHKIVLIQYLDYSKPKENKPNTIQKCAGLIEAV